MKTKEKFAALNEVIVATEMTEEELYQWFQSRRTSPVTTDDLYGIDTIFPIVYKKRNEFEVLPKLILEREDEIWGYEIMPNLILAKKCDGVTWNDAKAFAEKCVLNGKQGHLPSKEITPFLNDLKLRALIHAMDEFLCQFKIDAENYSVGAIWCSEVSDLCALIFSIFNGSSENAHKGYAGKTNRIAVSFSH